MIVRIVVALALVGSLLGASVGRAEPSALPGAPLLEASHDGGSWLLSVDFDVPLTPSLQDAVARGVPLYFVAEFELWRPRWWWRDELVAEESMVWRVSYHAVTRQYRLTANGVIQPFGTLDEALRALKHLRGWRVVEGEALTPETEYDARVRLRLDNSQLPKPFQVNRLTNRDWNPQAEWMQFTFTTPTGKNAP